MVSDVEDGHTALGVVGELGGAVLVQQLIRVAHYVLRAVLCARQRHLVTVQTALVWRQHAHLCSTTQRIIPTLVILTYYKGSLMQ